MFFLVLSKHVFRLSDATCRDELWKVYYGKDEMAICRVCGEDTITRHLAWQVAHIIPANCGGTTHWWNLVPSCL
jgi:5-methylcytosine-specific restriction endonuclease McrA